MTEGAGIDVKVRVATADDAPAAARIQLEGWRSAYREIFPPAVLAAADETVQTEKWRARLADGEGRFAHVAMVGAEAIGVLAGGPPRDPATAGDAEVYSLYVLSWWRGRGVGEALMAAAFTRLAAAGRRQVRLWTLSDNGQGRRFFSLLGGRKVATAERPSLGGLARSSTLYGWDDGAAAVAAWALRRSAVEIRHAEFDDSAGIARVQIETWRTAYRGIMPQRLLDDMNDVRISAFWAQVIAEAQGRSFCFVAQAGERVVGFSSGGPRQHSNDPARGEVYALYVLPEFQGRGVGRRLVVTSLERMLELGISEGRIWTLSDNAPARGFYERMGGIATDLGHNDIGGIKYPEVAYDWSDLRRWKEAR
ncbi:MAG: GNAT family N-acetyltransferase [Alphaproteobacteria bacterium]|nr:GNAT family N-acetyltransferase [Alphaproteobacteria bacterium]